jgi:glycosyltransferase involved in cell wall biosynthesis
MVISISMIKGRIGHTVRLIRLPIEITRFRLARITGKLIFNDNKPLVSVIIPTMPSRLELLESRALNSLSQQTYKHFEVYLVFDETNDEIFTIKDKFKNLDIQIQVTKPTFKNYPDEKIRWMVGAIRPLNHGIKKSQGTWIARLDDDDEWVPEHLSKSLSFAISNKFDFVSSHSTLIDKSGSRMDPAFKIDDPYYTGNNSRLPIGPRIGSPITWLMASYLKKIKYDRYSWVKKRNKPADLDMATRIYQSGARIGFLSESHATVRPRGDINEIGLNQFIRESEMDSDE